MTEFGDLTPTVKDSELDDFWSEFDAPKLQGATQHQDGYSEGEAAEEGEEPSYKKPGWQEEQESKLKSIISSRRKSLPHEDEEEEKLARPAKPARIRKAKSHDFHNSTPNLLARPDSIRRARSRPSPTPSPSRSKSRRELSPPHGGVRGDEGAPRRRRDLSPGITDHNDTSTRISKSRHTRTLSSDTPPTSSRPTRRPSKGGSGSPARKSSMNGSSRPRRAKSMDDSSNLGMRSRLHSSVPRLQMSPERKQRLTDRRTKQQMDKRKKSLRRLMDESTKGAPTSCILDEVSIDDSTISWSREPRKSVSQRSAITSSSSSRPTHGGAKRDQLRKAHSDKSRRTQLRSRSMDMSAPSVEDEISIDSGDKRDQLRKAHSDKSRRAQQRSRSMDMSAPSLDGDDISIDIDTSQKKQSSRRNMNYSQRSRSRSMDMTAPTTCILDDVSIDTTDSRQKQQHTSTTTNKKLSSGRRDQLHKSMPDKPSSRLRKGKSKPPPSDNDTEMTLEELMHSSSNNHNASRAKLGIATLLAGEDNNTSRTKFGIAALAGDDNNTSRTKLGIATLAGDAPIVSKGQRSKRNMHASFSLENSGVCMEDLAVPPAPTGSSLQKSRSTGNSKSHNHHHNHNSKTKFGIEGLAKLSQNIVVDNARGGGEPHHHNKSRSDKHLRGSTGSSREPKKDDRQRRERRSSKQRSLRNLDFCDDRRSKSPLGKHRSSRDLDFRSSTGSSSDKPRR